MDLKRTTRIAAERDGWRFDMENCPRKADAWIFVAFQIDGVNEVRNARWSSDRWMTPAGFVSARLAYAWAVRLEPPEPDEERDAMELI